MNSSLGFFNASAGIISQPMIVPNAVSFRSVKAYRGQKTCPYGYKWGRYGCLRDIYNAVQEPGRIHQAVGLEPMTTKHKLYTLPTRTVTTTKKNRKDIDLDPSNMDIDPPPKQRDVNYGGLWTVNKPPEPKPKSKPKVRAKEPEQGMEVVIVGDIDGPTPEPYWEPKWKRKPSKPKTSSKIIKVK